MVDRQLIQGCGANHINEYIAQRALGPTDRVGGLFGRLIVFVWVAGLAGAIWYTIGNRVGHLQGGLYGLIAGVVKCIGNASSVASDNTYHRYARNCGLQGVIVAMFFGRVVGSLLTVGVTGIGVGIKRQGALEIWGTFGVGIVFGEIGAYGASAVYHW